MSRRSRFPARYPPARHRRAIRAIARTHSGAERERAESVGGIEAPWARSPVGTAGGGRAQCSGRDPPRKLRPRCAFLPAQVTSRSVGVRSGIRGVGGVASDAACALCPLRWAWHTSVANARLAPRLHSDPHLRIHSVSVGEPCRKTAGQKRVDFLRCFP